MDIQELLKGKQGIYLDLGGRSGDPRFIGLDEREDADIVHDIETIPYPLPDECCLSILAANLLHQINPVRKGLLKLMDEWWRICKVEGRLLVSVPYGTVAIQDPTTCHLINENTFRHFDPTSVTELWNVYRPKPWQIVRDSWSSNGTLEVILKKVPVIRKDDKNFHLIES